MALNENRLHEWEEKYQNLCFVNMQKNLPVYNFKTKNDDFIFKGVRLYQADDVDKIINEVQKQSYQNILNWFPEDTEVDIEDLHRVITDYRDGQD